MENKTTFSVGETLKWGWEQFRAQSWFCVGIILLFFAINVALSFIAKAGVIGSVALLGVGQIIALLVRWWLGIGLIGILLAAYDGKPLTVEQLFSQKGKTLFNYVLGTIVYLLIVIGGTILLIIPGIIWSVKFHYYMFLIVDKGMGPIEALKESAHITKGYKWKIFWFFLVIAVINIAGAIVFFIGLLVTVPVTLLASVWVYRWLLKQNTQPTSETAAA